MSQNAAGTDGLLAEHLRGALDSRTWSGRASRPTVTEVGGERTAPTPESSRYFATARAARRLRSDRPVHDRAFNLPQLIELASGGLRGR